MSWKYRSLDKKLRAAIDLLGAQPWEKAFKDSEDKEYRVLRLDQYSREEEHQILAALDTLTITHTQKPMAPYKDARRSEYTQVLKVFSWSSIDSIVRMAKNPDTTVIEVAEAVKRAAALTCFERVFPDVDDYLAFQAALERGDIKDHRQGGIVLRLNLSNTTVEGLIEILMRSGLNTNLIEFSFRNEPEDVFIPNEAFPDNVRQVTVYDDDLEPTVRLPADH